MSGPSLQGTGSSAIGSSRGASVILRSEIGPKADAVNGCDSQLGQPTASSIAAGAAIAMS